jgi:dipeptidyl aminopeptidase/acylaminoacyl peptidase
VLLNKDEIVFQRGEGAGEEYIFRYNLESGKESQITSPKEYGNSRFELHKDSKGKGTSVVRYGPFNETEIFALSPDGKIKSIAKESLPKVGTVKRISIDSSDKFKYPAYVFSPKDTPKGTVIYVHGGDVNGLGNFSITNGNREIYELNRKGYAVMAVQYRGDSFFGGKNLSTPFFGTKDAEDIFVAKKYADKNMKGLPVFLYGFSHGASLVNLIVSKYSDEGAWAGAITQSGIWDVDTKSYISLDSKTSECQKKSLSALNYANSIKTPLLIIQGEKDPVSPISSFNKAKSKIPKEYLTAVTLNEGHRIEDCATWNRVMNKMITFMDKQRFKSVEGQPCIDCSMKGDPKLIDKIETISLKINQSILELKSCDNKR